MKYDDQFPQPTTLLRQRANVLDVLEHWPEEGCSYLQLDHWVSECGTYRCLFGDFLYRKSERMLWEFSGKMQAVMHGSGDVINYAKAHIHWHMGDMSHLDGWLIVFGSDECGTLNERKAALKTHLSHLNTQIAQWYETREVGVVG